MFSDSLAQLENELVRLKSSEDYVGLIHHELLGLKPEWVLELAQNDDWRVRLRLALNQVVFCNPEAVRILAFDESMEVRRGLASNPGIVDRPDIVAFFQRDTTKEVQQTIQNTLHPAPPIPWAENDRILRQIALEYSQLQERDEDDE